MRIGYGTDSGVYPHGDNARQFAYMVRYGMTPLEAIRSATISAAASLGRSQELGSIAPGKFANIIAVEGDPLEDVRRLEHVSGVIWKGELVTPGRSAMSDRQLGLGMATALVVGNTIGMGIFMQPAALAPFGLNALTGWAAVIFGCVCLAVTFAALARKLPQADGPFGYVRSTLGEVVAFPALWCYWISVWVTNAVLAIGVVGYFINVFPAAASIPPAVLAVTFMWIFVAVNLLGVRSGGRVQVVTSLLKVVPLVLVMVVGAFSILADPGAYTPNLPTTPLTGHASMAAAAVALYAMLGFESAAIAAGRVKDPQRNDPARDADRHAGRRRPLRLDRRDRHAGRAAGDARHLGRAVRDDRRPPARPGQRPLDLAVRRDQRPRLPERLDAALPAS